MPRQGFPDIWASRFGIEDNPYPALDRSSVIALTGDLTQGSMEN